jgi:hypothetical protein
MAETPQEEWDRERVADLTEFLPRLRNMYPDTPDAELVKAVVTRTDRGLARAGWGKSPVQVEREKMRENRYVFNQELGTWELAPISGYERVKRHMAAGTASAMGGVVGVGRMVTPEGSQIRRGLDVVAEALETGLQYQTPETRKFGDDFFGALMDTTAQTAPYMAGMMMSGGAGGPWAAFASAATTMGGGAFNEAKRRGLPDDRARLAGAVVGIVGGAIEVPATMLQLRFLTGKGAFANRLFGKLASLGDTSVIAAIGVGGLTEALQETSEELLEEGTLQYLGAPPTPEFWAQLAEVAIGSGLIGAMMGGGGASIGRLAGQLQAAPLPPVRRRRRRRRGRGMPMPELLKPEAAAALADKEIERREAEPGPVVEAEPVVPEVAPEAEVAPPAEAAPEAREVVEPETPTLEPVQPEIVAPAATEAAREAAAGAAEAREAGAKQPWEMTQEEFQEALESYPRPKTVAGDKILPVTDWMRARLAGKKSLRDAFGAVGTPKWDHAMHVAEALMEGKPVPAEVLAEHPDLKPGAGATEAEGVQPTPETSQPPAAAQPEAIKLGGENEAERELLWEPPKPEPVPGKPGVRRTGPYTEVRVAKPKAEVLAHLEDSLAESLAEEGRAGNPADLAIQRQVTQTIRDNIKRVREAPSDTVDVRMYRRVLSAEKEQQTAEQARAEGVQPTPETSQPPAEAAPEARTPDETWKVAELRAYAKENGIDLKGKRAKKNILAAIRGEPVAEQARTPIEQAQAAEEAEVVRREEPGVTPSLNKPQGLYLNRKGELTGVEPEMTQEFHYAWHPKNVLDVSGEDTRIVHERFDSALPHEPSAGIKALAKLVSPGQFEQLRAAGKADLQALFRTEYPDVQWGRYYDSYEMLEAYAGLKAREAGHDAILDIDERVALSEAAISAKPAPIKLGGENAELAKRAVERKAEKQAAQPATEQAKPVEGETEQERTVREFGQEQRDNLEDSTRVYSGLPSDQVENAVVKFVDGLSASLFRGNRLRKRAPKAFQAFRSLLSSKEVIQEEVMDFLKRQAGETTKADREALQFHREQPGKYPIPAGLEYHAQLLDALYAYMEKELVKRKLIGTFPESFINANLKKIAELKEDLAEVKTEKARKKRLDRIDELNLENDFLATLRYARHTVYLDSQFDKLRREGRLARVLKAAPKRLLGRKHATMERLREALAGTSARLETDAWVAVADALSYAQYKVAVYDFHEKLKAEGELVKKDIDAPLEWVELPGLDQYKGYRVYPALAEAIYDFTEPRSPTTKFGRLLDHLNSMWKQVRFYKFFIMFKNDVEQGFAAAGFRHFTHYKTAAKSVGKKDRYYRACQRADLFSIPPDIPQAQMAKEFARALRMMEEQSPEAWKWLKQKMEIDNVADLWKILLPTNKNLALVMNRKFTWWLDRVLRVATVKALEKKGYSFEDAVVRAREFHADYNILKQEPAKWGRRILLTPAYKVAMWGRLFPQLVRHPIKSRGAVARVAAMFMVSSVIMALKGYAWLQGYRYVKGLPPPEGEGEPDEDVILMFGPFSEVLKVPARLYEGYEHGGVMGAFQRVLGTQLAVVPGFVNQLLRNRDWKGDKVYTKGAPQDVKLKEMAQFTLRYLYPFLEEGESWRDEEQGQVNKILRIVAISKYKRGPMRKWYRRKLTKSLSDLRSWARAEARKRPDMADYYYQRAGREFRNEVEKLNDLLEHHEGKMEAMRSTSAIDRVAAQFGFRDRPATPTDPTLTDEQNAMRLWEWLGPDARKRWSESAEEFKAREDRQKQNRAFLSSYFENQGLDRDETERLLKLRLSKQKQPQWTAYHQRLAAWDEQQGGGGRRREALAPLFRP